MPWDPPKHSLNGSKEHKKHDRPTPYQRGYDRLWQKIRLAVLREEPLCRSCQQPATCVDHITPLKKGGDHSRWNLQPLCASCHNSKTWHESWGKRMEK
ncbi:MAG: HNH endonuclease [Rhodobacteraceae bacterium]|nr:HNH endonuclease [Paracoccaceae bacterium]